MNDVELQRFYEQTAAQVAREDGLVIARVTWLLTFNGFLFDALALVAEGKARDPLGAAISVVVPALGLLVAGATMGGVLAGVAAVEAVKVRWLAVPAERRRKFQQPFGERAQWFGGLGPSTMMPVLLAAAWLVVLGAVLVDWINGSAAAVPGAPW